MAYIGYQSGTSSHSPCGGFYANLRYTIGKKVFLRGCQVDFSSAAINSFYRTPEVENDVFTRILDGELNWKEVLETIGHLQSHWTYHA